MKVVTTALDSFVVRQPEGSAQHHQQDNRQPCVKRKLPPSAAGHSAAALQHQAAKHRRFATGASREQAPPAAGASTRTNTTSVKGVMTQHTPSRDAGRVESQSPSTVEGFFRVGTSAKKKPTELCKVKCPVCGTALPQDNARVNQHIDACLRGGAGSVPAPPKSPFTLSMGALSKPTRGFNKPSQPRNQQKPRGRRKTSPHHTTQGQLELKAFFRPQQQDGDGVGGSDEEIWVE